jgi:hypothetical protein
VIIDCGSTGSRLLAFTFTRSVWKSGLVLEEELWEEVKPGKLEKYRSPNGRIDIFPPPGLSAYAEDPTSAARSIRALLRSARAHIPEGRWGETPIALKATAGEHFFALPSPDPAD